MSATASSVLPMITIPYNQCTLDTCPVAAAQLPYAPNLAGNALFLSIFCISLLANLVLGIWCRTWGYLVAMVLGCVLEVLGYVGRVQMHYNPFPEDPFLLSVRSLKLFLATRHWADLESDLRYLICVTIASVFFTAAIYLCLARVVVAYGEKLSILRPRTYTILFIVWYVKS
jgi:hypothetical protein